jgi:AcrR family transcriptional regulator
MCAPSATLKWIRIRFTISGCGFVYNRRVDDDLRPLRADAARNQERVLDAARSLLATEGADSSMKAIAAAAGVGVATLYRRFPTREDLIEAVYRSENQRLAARASTLLDELAPVDALRAWAEEWVEYMLVKHGMAEALPAILTSRTGLRAESRQALFDAVGELLRAGRQDGTVRPLDPQDVLMLFGGITLVAEHEGRRALASRLLDLAFGGVLAPGGAEPASGSAVRTDETHR